MSDDSSNPGTAAGFSGFGSRSRAASSATLSIGAPADALEAGTPGAVSMIGSRCFSCDRVIEKEHLELGSVLVPRAAARGGPVLLFRCPGCGVENLVERSPAGGVLLSPPHLAGVPSLRGEALYAAKKWAETHRAERIAFLAGAAPSPAGTEQPVEAPPDDPGGEPPEDPPPAAVGTGEFLRAYEVLDLPLTASFKEIDRRYRELSKKCHPDLVADLDDDIRRLAERKFRRLTDAYERILAERQSSRDRPAPHR